MQPSEDCPHQFGYYRAGGPAECGEFFNCAEGRAYKLKCPLGLAFNKETYQCDWPDLVPDCDAESFLGFRCPTEPQSDGFGAAGTKFFKSSDCQRYFLCVNDKPRLYVCGTGAAFSEPDNTCIAAENVTGCEHLAIVEDDAEREPIYLKTIKLT